MRIIKLDAIDSTNDFLKALAKNETIENFTVVTAESQKKGKGQMGSVWISDPGKNLTVSILIKDVLSDLKQIYDLNVTVSVSIIEALETYQIPKLSIKWPNDIMSDAKKIGGILIENSVKNSEEIHSIVGFGLNVNQSDFENLPKASSLSIVMKTDFDKEILLDKILEKIQINVSLLKNGNEKLLWGKYKNLLFKKSIPMPFEDQNGKRFMGIINDVSNDGKLLLQLEDDSVKPYGIKEIQMLY